MLAGVINGCRHFKGDIPLVGSCSAAISASCHRVDDDSKAAEKWLMWGIVDGERGDDVGHCCLSSFEVGALIVGHLYAGVKRKED